MFKWSDQSLAFYDSIIGHKKSGIQIVLYVLCIFTLIFQYDSSIWVSGIWILYWLNYWRFLVSNEQDLFMVYIRA